MPTAARSARRSRPRPSPACASAKSARSRPANGSACGSPSRSRNAPASSLLDEPTTHLDLRFAIETLTLLRRLAADGAVVIAVLHSLEEAAAFADRVVVLGDGARAGRRSAGGGVYGRGAAAAYGIAIDVEQRDGQLAFRRGPRIVRRVPG